MIHPPGIEFRWANAEDEAAIKALVRSSNLNPLGVHWQRFLVAEDKAGDVAQIVGIGQVKVHGDGSRELASIATVPDRQGHGIATAIIRQLLETDAVTGYGALYLTCRGHMEPFYQRFGFHRAGDVASLPPYFRRLMRLAWPYLTVGRLLGKDVGGLVMVRKGD
jgi:N-acetylglutamate synthase-like GNAT family acetyltransferase